MAGRTQHGADTSEDVRQQLQEAENRFAALEASLPDGLAVLDADLRVAHVNTSFERMFAWTEDELIGSDLLFIKEDERSKLKKRLRPVLKGKSLETETIGISKSGEVFDVLATGEVFSNADGSVGGICLVLKDRSHEKELEKSLTLSGDDLKKAPARIDEEAEFADKKTKADVKKRIELEKHRQAAAETFEKLMTGPGPALAVFDLFGQERSANRRLAGLLGYRPDELPDAISLHELLPEKWRDKITSSNEDLPKQGFFSNHDVELVHKKGKSVWLAVCGGVLDYRSDGNHRIVISAVDITQRRKRDAELAEANERLLARNNELESQMRERKRRTDELTELTNRQQKSIKKANEAMRLLISDFSDQKKDLEERISENFRLTVYPLMEDLRGLGLSRAHEQILDTLDFSIRHITSYFGINLATSDVRLTDREVQICNMIREGKSSRDIAEATKLSYQTVIVHRKNIRRKLGIKKTKQNLTTYLQQTLSGRTIPRS